MASFADSKAMPFKFAYQFQSKLVNGWDDQIYYDFRRIIQQFREKEIDSYTTVAAVEKLLENHSDLLLVFKSSFMPTNIVFKTSELKSSVGFLTRVGSRLNQNDVYNKFLSFMASYSKGEITTSEVSDNVSVLFGKKNRDLALEFKSFLPESFKENNGLDNPNDQDHEEFRVFKKRRNSNPNSDDQEEIRVSKRTRNSNPKTVPYPRGMKNDDDMEEAMFKLDMQRNKLSTTCRNAKKALINLCNGRVSTPMDMNEHFTQKDLGYIKRYLYTNRQFVKMEKEMRENPGSELTRLIDSLKTESLTLEKSRAELKERWLNIHQSHRR